MKTLKHIVATVCFAVLGFGEQSILVENRNSRSPAHYLSPNAPPSLQVWIFDAVSKADAFMVTVEYSDMQGHEAMARMVCRDPNRGATVTCAFTGVDALETDIRVTAEPVVFNQVQKDMRKGRL